MRKIVLAVLCLFLISVNTRGSTYEVPGASGPPGPTGPAGPAGPTGPVGPPGPITSITATAPLTGGTITTSGSIGLTSPLPIANGGTGSTTFLDLKSNPIFTSTSEAPISIEPNDNGALIAESSTATHGNSRGAGAVDLQLTKSDATHVAAGAYSVVAGGIDNKNSGVYAVISGGRNNDAESDYDVIGGGQANAISPSGAMWGTIAGGDTNYISSGVLAFIGGGNNNTIAASDATISGGSYGTANGSNSTIGGGSLNYAFGSNSCVFSGVTNTAYGPGSVVAGGASNVVGNNATDAVISGGENNNIVGNTAATIAGGNSNVAVGNYNTVAGAWNWTTGGSTAVFGKGNYVKNNFSVALGGGALDTNINDFVIGNVAPTNVGGVGTVDAVHLRMDGTTSNLHIGHTTDQPTSVTAGTVSVASGAPGVFTVTGAPTPAIANGQTVTLGSSVAGVSSQSVTLATGSPGVFTTSGTSLSNGTQVTFSNGNIDPVGLAPNTLYYVVSASGANFSVALTPGGTALNIPVAGVPQVYTVTANGFATGTRYFIVGVSGSTFNLSYTQGGPAIPAYNSGSGIALTPMTYNNASAQNRLYLHTVNASNQSQAVTVAAPATLTTGWNMVLPTTTGNAANVLQTDGSGNTSWVAPTPYTNVCSAATTCTATCGAGNVTGGGCQDSALVAGDSFPASTTTWQCDAASAVNITAYVICI